LPISKERVDWLRGLSLPSMLMGRPRTKPATSRSRHNPASSSTSLLNFVRLIVCRGEATVRLGSEMARPMVFSPISRPSKRPPGLTEAFSSCGLRIAMRDASCFALSNQSFSRRALAMSIDKETVKKVASLARLRLGEDEMSHYANEISGILKWIEQLSEVNTDNVEPMDK